MAMKNYILILSFVEIHSVDLFAEHFVLFEAAQLFLRGVVFS